MSETKNELETLLERRRPSQAIVRHFSVRCWNPPCGYRAAAEGEQIVEDSALDLQHWEKMMAHR
jgi:hypothetical protein